MRPHRSSALLAPLLGTMLACSGASKSGPGPSVESGQPEATAGKKQVLPTMAPSCSEDGRTEDVKTSDVDSDGRPDVWKFYGEVEDDEAPEGKKKALVRQDLDLNWDGRVDICRYFGPDGRVKREELDLDYDGKVDEVSEFAGGVVTMKRRDRNNDGRPDIIRRYEGGRLVRKESDTNDDGQMDRFEFWENGKLDRIGIDTDHDGKLDEWVRKSELKRSS